MAITLPYDFTSDTLTKARLQEVLDLLAAANSQIGAENILAGAGIPQSKLGRISGSVNFERSIQIQNWDSGWPASGSTYANVIGKTFLPIVDDVWTFRAYKYVIQDVNVTCASQFNIEYGYLTVGNPPVWNKIKNVVTGITMTDIDTGAGGLAIGEASSVVALDGGSGQTAPCLALTSASAAVPALLTAGTMTVTFVLARTVTL